MQSTVWLLQEACWSHRAKRTVAAHRHRTARFAGLCLELRHKRGAQDFLSAETREAATRVRLATSCSEAQNRVSKFSLQIEESLFSGTCSYQVSQQMRRRLQLRVCSRMKPGLPEQAHLRTVTSRRSVMPSKRPGQGGFALCGRLEGLEKRKKNAELRALILKVRHRTSTVKDMAIGIPPLGPVAIPREVALARSPNHNVMMASSQRNRHSGRGDWPPIPVRSVKLVRGRSSSSGHRGG